MARRISGSWLIACLVAVAGALTLPRLYNYDKALFLALGLFMCWRYIARPTVGWLAALAVTTAVAALYRYDSGVYVGLAACVGIGAVHMREWRRALTRLAVYGGIVLATLSPALVFVASTAGLPDAARQIAEYGRREGLRTGIFSMPRLRIDTAAPLYRVGIPVNIRYAPGVTRQQRDEFERTYSLRDGTQAEGATWRYRLEDVSRDNLLRLIGDGRIEDTHGFDRGADAIGRVAQGYQVLPGVLTLQNAAAWLALVLLALPVAAMIAVAAGRAGPDWPLLLSAAALCLTADLILLRDPLEARIGDVTAPAVPLAAWAIAAVYRQARPIWWRAAQVAVAPLLIVSVAAVFEFSWPVLRAEPVPREQLVETPPSLLLLSSSHSVGVIEYVRECTSPDDRVMAAWFAPEVFYFAGRGFAGGMSVYFGGHWSRPSDQQRAVARLRRESVPIAIVPLAYYGEFRADFPILDNYLRTAYRVAAESSMSDSENSYRIYVRHDAPARGASARFGLPCFR
jgi:hypothetical protein